MLQTKQLKPLINKIEKEYQKELALYQPHKKGVKSKDMCAILMARGLIQKNKIWWYAWENIGRHDEFFGSHKVPARMSDLSLQHPEYFESRGVGIYKVYRIRFELLTAKQINMMAMPEFKVKNLYK